MSVDSLSQISARLRDRVDNDHLVKELIGSYRLELEGATVDAEAVVTITRQVLIELKIFFDHQLLSLVDWDLATNTRPASIIQRDLCFNAVLFILGLGAKLRPFGDGNGQQTQTHVPGGEQDSYQALRKLTLYTFLSAFRALCLYPEGVTSREERRLWRERLQREDGLLRPKFHDVWETWEGHEETSGFEKLVLLHVAPDTLDTLQSQGSWLPTKAFLDTDVYAQLYGVDRSPFCHHATIPQERVGSIETCKNILESVFARLGEGNVGIVQGFWTLHDMRWCLENMMLRQRTALRDTHTEAAFLDLRDTISAIAANSGDPPVLPLCNFLSEATERLASMGMPLIPCDLNLEDDDIQDLERILRLRDTALQRQVKPKRSESFSTGRQASLSSTVSARQGSESSNGRQLPRHAEEPASPTSRQNGEGREALSPRTRVNGGSNHIPNGSERSRSVLDTVTGDGSTCTELGVNNTSRYLGIEYASDNGATSFHSARQRLMSPEPFNVGYGRGGPREILEAQAHIGSAHDSFSPVSVASGSRSSHLVLGNQAQRGQTQHFTPGTSSPIADQNESSRSFQPTPPALLHATSPLPLPPGHDPTGADTETDDSPTSSGKTKHSPKAYATSTFSKFKETIFRLPSRVSTGVVQTPPSSPPQTRPSLPDHLAFCFSATGQRIIFWHRDSEQIITLDWNNIANPTVMFRSGRKFHLRSANKFDTLGKVGIWHVQGGNEVIAVTFHDATKSSTQQPGYRLVCFKQDHRIEVNLPSSNSIPIALAVSRDDKTVAVGFERKVVLYSVGTALEEVISFPAHSRYRSDHPTDDSRITQTLSFSVDSSLLVVATQEPIDRDREAEENPTGTHAVYVRVWSCGHFSTPKEPARVRLNLGYDSYEGLSGAFYSTDSLNSHVFLVAKTGTQPYYSILPVTETTPRTTERAPPRRALGRFNVDAVAQGRSGSQYVFKCDRNLYVIPDITDAATLHQLADLPTEIQRLRVALGFPGQRIALALWREGRNKLVLHRMDLADTGELLQKTAYSLEEAYLNVVVSD